jgi:hypothetical protein
MAATKTKSSRKEVEVKLGAARQRLAELDQAIRRTKPERSLAADAGRWADEEDLRQKLNALREEAATLARSGEIEGLETELSEANAAERRTSLLRWAEALEEQAKLQLAAAEGLERARALLPALTGLQSAEKYVLLERPTAHQLGKNAGYLQAKAQSMRAQAAQ